MPPSKTKICLVEQKSWYMNIQYLTIWHSFDIRQMPPSKLKFGLFSKNHEIWIPSIKPFDIRLIFAKCPPPKLKFILFSKNHEIRKSNIQPFDIRLIFVKCPPPKLKFVLLSKNRDIWISNIQPFDIRLIFAKCPPLKLNLACLAKIRRFEYLVSNHLIFVWYLPNAPLQN